MWATFKLGFYAVKSQPDAVVAEFKYCKSHMCRILVESQIIDSLFSISRLMYRHPISASGEQKPHFVWYRDAPRENLTPETQTEGLQCFSTREISARHKLPHALLSLKMSYVGRSNASVTSVSFYVPCQNSQFKLNKRDAFWSRHLFLQAKGWSGIGNRFHCLPNWIRY